MAANDALVLSGGASQGDFEVGAVRRLFELGFQPGLIVATSVGSVNAVKLVESGALATTGQPSGLEQIWLGLAGNDSMYTNNPAFNLPSLQAVTGNNPENILEGDTIAAFVSGVASLVGIPFAGLAAVALLANLGLDLKKAGQDLTQFLQQLQQSLLSAQSIYTLDPIKTLLNNANILNPNHVDSSSIKLLLAMVSLETGDLRFVNQHGVLLEADTKTPHLETGAVPQKCQKLADDVTAALDNLQGIGGPGDYPTVAAYQAALGAAKAALQKARLALAACEQQNPQSPQQVVVAVPDAVLASASIPFVFPPVKLGHDNYVDGGVRQTVPISGAIAAGATNVWAVTANHVSVSPLPVVDQLTKATITSYDHASCLQIAQRAAEDIMSAQIEQDNMAPLVAWGSATVTVVQPEDGTVPPDIHTGFTVDPGLIRIRMAT